MTLHGTIQENGKSIAAWEARRIFPTGDRPRPDDTCQYAWNYVDLQDGGRLTGQLDHRYGDGAAKLLVRVLRAAGA